MKLFIFQASLLAFFALSSASFLSVKGVSGQLLQTVAQVLGPLQTSNLSSTLAQGFSTSLVSSLLQCPLAPPPGNLTRCAATPTVPPKAGMSTAQMIQNAGYSVENHTVITADGYILTLFRIPRNKANQAGTKEPILLQHGLLCSSNDWLLVNDSDCLPYLLSEAGHDVWLGNARGNNYSQGHINASMNSSTTAYWQFSYDEMGKYDIPAVIQYMLDVTSAPQISYVAHSMGNVMFFIAADQNPTLINGKVKRMASLAPAVYVSNSISPIKALSVAPTNFGQALFDTTGSGQVIPAYVNQFIYADAPTICAGLDYLMCQNIIFLIAGFDYNQTSCTTASLITGHTPQATSYRVMEQYLQQMRSPNPQFQAYDLGSAAANQAKYNSATPPLYSLNKCTVPVFVMYGLNDWLVVPKDANRTINELNNVYKNVSVNAACFGHLDFTYANDVKALVYNQVLDFFNLATLS